MDNDLYINFGELCDYLKNLNDDCYLVRIITSYYYTRLVEGRKVISKGPRIFYGLITKYEINSLVRDGYDLYYHHQMIDVNLLHFGDYIKEIPYCTVLPTGKMMLQATEVFNRCAVRFCFSYYTNWSKGNDKYHSIPNELPNMVKVFGKDIIDSLNGGRVRECIVPEYIDEINDYIKCQKKKRHCR